MTSRVWARRSLYAGLVLMVVGLVDPLEGAVVIAAGTGLVAALRMRREASGPPAAT